MKKLILSIFILLFILSQRSLAQEVFRFFEFAPRSTDYIYLNAQTLIQPFIPFNDYLSIIGLWVDNKERSSIRLKLIDQNNNILFNKEINIPVIYGIWYGEEYQIPLGKNLKINSGQEYKLIIEGLATSSLKVFSKNILEILQGSENYLYFPETLKPYHLNNETTNFTLKLSLYEGIESTPPIITNLKVNVLSPTSTSITFNANEPIMYKLEYVNISTNSTSTYSINYFESCPASIRNCTINLITLPDSYYHFILIANDFWNNTSTLSGEFRTPKESIIIPLKNTTTSITETTTIYSPKLEQKSIEKHEDKTVTTSTINLVTNKNIVSPKPIFTTPTPSKEPLNLKFPQQKQPPYPTSLQNMPTTFKYPTINLTPTLIVTSTFSKQQFLIFKFLQKQKINIFLIVSFSVLILLGFLVYKKFIKK